MSGASWLLLSIVLASPDVPADPRGPGFVVTVPAGVPMGRPVLANAGEPGEAAIQRAGRRRSSASSGAGSRRLGLGGQVGISNRGAAGAIRYWFTEQIGVDASVSWYRSNRRRSDDAPDQSTFRASPSVLFLLTRPDPTRAIDLRPYVGLGVSYTRATTPATPNATALRSGGTGLQGFGGAEVTFRDAPSIAISAEAGYYQIPTRLAGSDAVGRFNFVVGVHYYLR